MENEVENTVEETQDDNTAIKQMRDRIIELEGVEKEYAVHDTRQSLIEAKNKGIIPFCLTVDKSGHDYMKTMMEDFSYEVLTDISMLPKRLPQLYKNLTT